MLKKSISLLYIIVVNHRIQKYGLNVFDLCLITTTHFPIVLFGNLFRSMKFQIKIIVKYFLCYLPIQWTVIGRHITNSQKKIELFNYLTMVFTHNSCWTHFQIAQSKVVQNYVKCFSFNNSTLGVLQCTWPRR